MTLENTKLGYHLQKIGLEKEPKQFKECLLKIAQLYFEGLVEESSFRGVEVWAEQLEALEVLLKGIRLTVANFYRRDENIPFSEVLELVMPYESILTKYGSKNTSRLRHMYGEESTVRESVGDIVRSLDEEIDLVIPVASGGFEAAALISDYLDVGQVFPVRYSNVSRNDWRVLVPKCAPKKYAKERIEVKNILIVDDIVDSGGTARKLIRWANKNNPTKVYFATIKLWRPFSLEKYNNSGLLYVPKV